MHVGEGSAPTSVWWWRGSALNRKRGRVQLLPVEENHLSANKSLDRVARSCPVVIPAPILSAHYRYGLLALYNLAVQPLVSNRQGYALFPLPRQLPEWKA